MDGHIFKNRRLNVEKLLNFGFEACENGYACDFDLLGGQMRLDVCIDADGCAHTNVTDVGSGEEYVLHRVAGAKGAFVGRVRTEYEVILKEISDKCFDPDVFKSRQAKEIIAYIGRAYGDALEYLWKKFPDNAVVRRKDNQKWYAALLTVASRKIGLNSDETIEILDLRIAPEEIERTVDHVRYFPGYHMNKKHWITICLNGALSIEEIYSRIDDSYCLARKKNIRNGRV